MKKTKIILLLGDILILYISLVLMLYLRLPELFGIEIIILHLYPFTLIFSIWLVVFYIWDLYNFSLIQYRTHFFKAMVMNIVLAMVIFYISPGTNISPKTNLFITYIIFAGLFFLWRSIFLKLLKQNKNTLKIGIIGVSTYTKQLINIFGSNKYNRYSLEYIVRSSGSNNKEWEEIEKLLPDTTKVYNTIDELESEENKFSVSTLIVGEEAYKNKVSELYKYIVHGVSIYHIASFFEERHGIVPIYATSEIWLLDNLKEDGKKEFERAKRIEDIIMGLIGLPFLIFFFPFIFLGIKITSKGPLLFNQVRVGKNNKPFKIHKFRTMSTDAEKGGAQWASKNDSRITSFGKFLRVSRLDELPQLLNIFKGEMSFVGPRPERPEFVTVFEEKIPHYSIRHVTKPGLTGWAQVNAGYAAGEEDTARKLEYDLYYIKNRDLILDFKIILKTIVTVLQRKGR